MFYFASKDGKAVLVESTHDNPDTESGLAWDKAGKKLEITGSPGTYDFDQFLAVLVNVPFSLTEAPDEHAEG